MTAKKRTKYDKITAVNDRLATSFARIDHPNAQQLAKIFGKCGSGLWEQIQEKDPSVTRSQIAAGLEQGLRDLALMVAGQPDEIRADVVSAFGEAVRAEYPEFFKKDKERLAKVLSRGQVRSESEWYLLRDRIDQIEGESKHEKELLLLYQLVDDYDP